MARRTSGRRSPARRTCSPARRGNHGDSYEGYNGRLLKISGRNANTYVALTYFWQCGAAASNENLAEIDVSTQSGVTAKLYFANFGGHQLLSRLVWPDGVTTVTYSYDAAGNLVVVQKPGPNNTGASTFESYVWNSNCLVITSPRFNANNADGGYIAAMWASPAHTVQGIQSVGVMNFTPPDGTNTPLQQNAPTAQMQYNWTGVGNYSPGINEIADTDGHHSYYYFDGSNRVTEVAEWTGAVWLGTWFGWDTNNNLTGEQDARGNVTNYAYDPNGNTIAVGEPQTTTSQGTFRPTRLYDYDAFNNVVAYCDQMQTHQAGADWVAAPAISDSLCSSNAGGVPHVTFGYTYPAYEPNGELTSSTTPLGYTHRFSYMPSQQAGGDYGLPTSVVGDAIAQNDPTTPSRQPQQSFWYDGNGNLVCYGTGAGQWLLSYDALGRLTSTADPDDASSGPGVCGKTGAQPNWNTTARTTYFPDGAVASKQTASQAASGVSNTFTYDADGNEATETHYYGCATTSNCTAGVTRKYYDGADRLVEVLLPYDGWDVQSYAWGTRYIYDLSRGLTTPYRGMGLTAYGNLASTQELLSGTVWTPNLQTTYGIATGIWTDVRATAFDALDRPVASYEAAFGDQPKEQRTYDGAGQAGLLSSVRLATNELKQYTYDGIGRQTDIGYSGDGGVTPGAHFVYDAAGHLTSQRTDTLGAQSMQYDAAGNLLSVTEPAAVGGGTISYDYYPDGTRQDLKYIGGGYSYTPLLRYAYRNDGERELLQLDNGTSFRWTYTAAGRELSQSDPLTGTMIHPDATHDAGGKGGQAPWYPASMTYVSRSLAYDSYGRLSHLGLPEALASSLSYDDTPSQYDLEDEPIAEIANRYSQSNSGVGANVVTLECRPKNARNEQLPQRAPFMNGVCSSIVPAHIDYNGTIMTPINQTADTQAASVPWTIDARAGMLVSDLYTTTNGNSVNSS